MTHDEFTQFVTKHKEENIIGFVFDNSSRELFYNREFKMADHYDVDTGCLMMPTTDGSKNPFIVAKHIENIQAILVGTDKTIWEKLDPRYMGG